MSTTYYSNNQRKIPKREMNNVKTAIETNVYQATGIKYQVDEDAINTAFNDTRFYNGFEKPGTEDDVLRDLYRQTIGNFSSFIINTVLTEQKWDKLTEWDKITNLSTEINSHGELKINENSIVGYDTCNRY